MLIGSQKWEKGLISGDSGALDRVGFEAGVLGKAVRGRLEWFLPWNRRAVVRFPKMNM